MLLGSAEVDATWAGPPTADEIQAKDETRLLGGDDLRTGRDRRGHDPGAPPDGRAHGGRDRRRPDPLYRRSDLPAPEELLDPGAIHQPRARERGPAGQGGEDFSPTPWPGDRLQPDEVVWFRMDVGRNKNADPKWLIPLICRLGHVTKKEIGAIRIFPDETRFEIAKTHEGLFRDALKNSPRDDVTITPSEAPTPGGAGGYKGGAKKPFKRDDERGGDRPARPPFAKKPFNRDERTGDGPRPEFKKKPYAPRTDAERGAERAPRAEGDKPFSKAPGAKKPFQSKPGFKPAGKPGAKPFNKAGKPGKRFD